MPKSDKVYLFHIRDEIDFILKNTADKNSQCLQDELFSKAIVRSLEIIGEASKRVSANVKENTSEIPWREMAGTRDKLIHDYFGIDMEIVWDIISNELPELKTKVEKAIQSLGTGS